MRKKGSRSTSNLETISVFLISFMIAVILIWGFGVDHDVFLIMQSISSIVDIPRLALHVPTCSGFSIAFELEVANSSRCPP